MLALTKDETKAIKILNQIIDDPEKSKYILYELLINNILQNEQLEQYFIKCNPEITIYYNNKPIQELKRQLKPFRNIK